MNNKEQILANAQVLFDSENYLEVTKVLTEDLLAIHCDERLYLRRGSAKRMLGKLDDAFQDIAKALEINPNYSDAYGLRGGIWLDKKEYDKALKDCEKAIDLKRSNGYAYYNKGSVYFSMKLFDLAIECYNKSLEFDAADSNVYYTYYARGIAYSQLKKYDNALEDYNKALVLSPGYSDIYNDRGIVWHYKNNIANAFKDFNTAIDLNPKNAKAYNSRGVIWRIKKEYDKAFDDFDKAISIDKTYPHFYTNRGAVRHDQKQYKEAIVDHSTAIELDPNHVSAYENRGIVYMSQGEYARAIKDFKQALEQDPKSDALTLISKVQEKYDEINVLNGHGFERSDNIGSIFQLWINILDESELLEPKKLEILKICAEIKRDCIDVIKDFASRGIAEIISRGVVHYTKLEVADAIILSKSGKQRFYNAEYMNDPEEGRTVLSFMGGKIEKMFQTTEIESSDIYIGSFLPANQHEDELLMWRTYGKDSQYKEAAGCSIVFESNYFDIEEDDGLILNTTFYNYNAESTRAKAPQKLYRVIYYDSKNNVFICDNANEVADLMNELKKRIHFIHENVLSETNADDCINKLVYHLLTEIRYLFKNVDYSFENELRVIQFATPDSPFVLLDTSDMKNIPKRLFVDSNKPALSFIKCIILGPKVPNPRQWIYLQTIMRKRGFKHFKLMASKQKYQ